MDTASVRYIVDDVDAAIGFYTGLLGFEVGMRPAPGFAALRRGSLQLLINAPGAGGGANRSQARRQDRVDGIGFSSRSMTSTSGVRGCKRKARSFLAISCRGKAVDNCWCATLRVT